MTDLSNWLTEPEAANILQVSERTLRRMAATPEGPERRDRPVAGRKVRRADLDKLDDVAELSKCGQQLTLATDELRDTLRARKAGGAL